MRSLWLRLAMGVAMGLWLQPAVLGAQEQYQGLDLAPNEIYEALTEYGKSDDFERVAKVVEHARPLIASLAARSREDLARPLERALARRDGPRVRGAIARIIFWDTRLLLEAIPGAKSEAQRRDVVEMAYVSYSFLAPSIEAHQPGRSDEIHDAFRALYRAAGSPIPASLTDGLVRTIAGALGGSVG